MKILFFICSPNFVFLVPVERLFFFLIPGPSMQSILACLLCSWCQAHWFGYTPHTSVAAPLGYHRAIKIHESSGSHFHYFFFVARREGGREEEGAARRHTIFFFKLEKKSSTSAFIM